MKGVFFTEFSIPVTYETWDCVTVQANDERDLAKKLRSKNFIDEMSLPDDDNYVDDSFKIDTEGINGNVSITDDGKQGPDINLTDEDFNAIDNPTWDEEPDG